MKKKALLISVIIILLISFFRFASQSGKMEGVIKQQEIELDKQHEIIRDKKIIAQRQTAARAVSTNDNIVWLRQHRCKDC